MRIGSWEAALRGVPGFGYLIEAVNMIIVSVMTGYHTEHESDDRHKIIHATGSIFERGRTALALGDWLNVPFVPGHFTGFTTMTWTVAAANVTTWAYTLIGSTMIVAFDLRTTTVGGAPTAALQIKIPDGWYAAKTVRNKINLVDNGVIVDGHVDATANSNLLQIFRFDLAAFMASAGLTNVQGELSFPVRTA